MKNATLVINNAKAFADDIWQYDADFTLAQWKETMEGFLEIVAEAKEKLEELELDDFGDDKLYQLGDIVNFFASIDVLERKTNEA